MNNFTNIHEKYIKHFERKHEQELMNKVPQLREKQLLSCLPDNLPVSAQNVINVINKKFSIPKEEISNTIQRLIDSKQIASSIGFKSRTKYIVKP